MSKKYSELSIAVDLISDVFKTSNPIIIAEKIEEELDLEFTIHQISDYLDINKKENYELESSKVEYYSYNT